MEYYTKKYSEKYQKLVDNLSAKNISVKYCADLEDAILDCGSDDLVIYQSEFLASLRAASNAMEKALTEDFGIQERKRTHYASIDEERVSYLAITQHQYMGRKKVFAMAALVSIPTLLKVVITVSASVPSYLSNIVVCRMITNSRTKAGFGSCGPA